MIKLFLDDYRWPTDCAKYMHRRIGADNIIYTKPDWVVVRDYHQFKRVVDENVGNISHVSFDHDLADEHYHYTMNEGEDEYNKYLMSECQEKTGTDCAKYLKEVYTEEDVKLPIIYIHSMNPVGCVNIKNVFN